MLDDIVVTGAAGFIGSHVAETLAQEGFKVIHTDARVPSRSEGEWKQVDLTDFQGLLDLTKDAHAVCHIGGIGDVYVAAAEPRLALHVNGCGTLNLLEACRMNRVERFIYASTWEVYGPARYEPIDEGHPCAPAHPYSISKLTGDLLVQGHGARGAPRPTVLRLGTAYGPRMRENAVIPAFILRAMRGQPIEIHGSGDQFRQFTHARDIANAFRLALKAEAPGAVYNIVSPERITIRQLAEAIQGRIPAKVNFGPSRPSDAPSAFVESVQAGKGLGWYPRVSFDKGLDELMGIYLSQRPK